MKKYRRSFWAASCVNSMIIPWIVAFVFSYLSVKDRIDISRVLSFYGLIFGGIPTLVIFRNTNFGSFDLFLCIRVLCYLVR